METKAEYLTVKEIANLLNVKPNCIYRMLNNGEIPFYKVGGVKRIHRDDIKSLRVQNDFHR